MTTTDYYDYLNTSETSMPCSLQTDDVLGPTFRPLLLWVVCVAGSLGNGLVLWVLLLSRVRGMADVCLLNLALADLLLALLLPLWTHTATDVDSGAGSNALCKVKVGVYQLGFASGLLFVTLMSLDRYLAIVHAVRSSAVRKLHYSLLASVVVWASAVTFAIIKAVFYVSKEDQCVPEYPSETADTWLLVHNFGEIALCLGLCLPVVTFCYINILFVVRQQKSSKKGRAVRLIFAIVCVFIVFWVPYNVAVLLQTLGNPSEWNDCETSQRLVLAVEVTEVITLTHCCINPVIYAFVGEKFRKSFATMFVRYRHCMKLCPAAMSPHYKPSDIETSNTPVSSSRIE
ncbi:hypothetical protein ACEWY4_020401 [Coilia grayii]|uniref:G-protein coupled receptors family 1 profile domain-containing protein n=1 Tax=Coilia grayii TaxID=363190 RepID=A0ABD1JCK0_9TELE